MRTTGVRFWREPAACRGSRPMNMTFFVAAFSMLAKLTRADGHVSKAEIDSIEGFMANDLNLSPQSRNVAVDVFQSALDSPHSFQDYAIQFYEQFRLQPQILEFMIDILFRVSTADGNLAEAEERLIRSASDIFNFSEARYAHIRSRYANDIDRYYAILGVSRNDSIEQIKKSHRKLVSEYHPDKIASKGLPEEFIKFATDKFREIQEAYEQIQADKGFK
jgi:DnaJ like chaperone protein